MSNTPQGLGGRLRELRLASGKSQAEVALEFGVSRSTIAQIELGNRKLQAEELGRFAQICGCSPSSLLASGKVHEPREDDDLLADLLHAAPEFSSEEDAREEVRRAIAMARELTLLEQTLGLEGYAAAPPTYGFGLPNTQWQGAHQGYVAAQEERWRMNLGDAPIRGVDDTLAMTRVRATQAHLPKSIQCLYLQSPETGTVVIANQSLSMEERRFQYAHGYAHALFDDGLGWIACRADARNTPLELRATAFAGRFLLPETGVRRYLHSLGKDTLGRASAAVQKLYSEVIGSKPDDPSVLVGGRGRPGASSINTCDLTQIASYYGVSPALTAHNLRNLRFMSDDELAAVIPPAAKGDVTRTQEALDLRTLQNAPKRGAFQSRLLALAAEALRRGVVDDDHFARATEFVGVTPRERRILIEGESE